MVIPEIIQHVKKNMLGRICDEQGNVALMAETICNGNHLEIGTLHGGSAIVVALVKKEYGFSGDVYCVDPLNGYYLNSNCPKKWQSKLDPISKVPICIETIEENMKRFGVTLNIIQASSNPYPLHDETFSTAYIDGDHWGTAPLDDFMNVSQKTLKFITFDNCDKNHPDVLKACNVAEQVWLPHKREGIICIVKRPNEVKK